MSNCYICDCKLQDSNKYEEHIIINAIGGKLKSKDLLCNKCGSKYDHLDASLAKNFELFSNFFNIKRDRGKTKKILATESGTGRQFTIDSEDNQKIVSRRAVTTTENGKVIIKGIFNDENELRTYLETEKTRHYPDLNVEVAIQNAKPNFRYIDYQPIEFNIGGEENFGSILKTAINYFIYLGHSKDYISHLIQYLDTPTNISDVIFLYDGMKSCDTLTNFIYIKGDSEKKILYSIVELFGMVSFIVLMNENYTGISFEETYCHDLNNNQLVTKDFTLNLSLSDIKQILYDKKVDSSLMQIIFQKLFQSRHQEKIDGMIDTLSQEIIKEYASKHSGEEFTEERSEELISMIVKKILPIIQQFSQENKI